MFNKNRFFFNQNTNPKTFLHTIVKIYKSGDSFGELGIINRCNRSATIITTSNCKFASLNEEHFKPIFNLKIQEILYKKLVILKTVLKGYCLKDNIQKIGAYFER